MISHAFGRLVVTRFGTIYDLCGPGLVREFIWMHL